MENIIRFDDETLKVLKELTQAIKENNSLLKDGNSNEFAREVCANIYADYLIETLFPEGFNRHL